MLSLTSVIHCSSYITKKNQWLSTRISFLNYRTSIDIDIKDFNRLDSIKNVLLMLPEKFKILIAAANLINGRLQNFIRSRSEQDNLFFSG